MTKCKILLFCLVSLLGLSLSAQANQLYQFRDIHVGLANLTQYVGKVQTNDSGDQNTLEFNPMIVGGTRWYFFQDLSLLPEVALGLPQKGRDPNISKMYAFSTLSINWDIENFSLHAGTGFSFTHISSDGGTEALPNGNGTDSFPLPSGNTTTRNVIVQMGAGYSPLDEFSIKIQGQLFNPFNSRNRAFSYVLALNYHYFLEGQLK